MKKRGSKKKKIIIALTAACLLSCFGFLFAKSRVLAAFNENEAVTYGEYSASNTIENSTIFYGTYLISMSAMTDELYEKAQESATESNQTSMFYKSELADGAWFDVTDAETLKDIMNTAVKVPDSELQDLFVRYHVTSDGTVKDAKTGEEVNPFDIPDPYNLSKLKELEPLWLYYASSTDADDVSQSDYLKNKNSSATGNKRTDIYVYQLLSTFFAMDLKDEDTDRYDADLARLYEAYKNMKAAGNDEEAAIIYSLMEKVDASRRAIVMDKLSVMEINALDVLNDLASGKYYTVMGDFLDPAKASEKDESEDADDGGNDFNDISEDPEYIRQLKECVSHEFESEDGPLSSLLGNSSEDGWWTPLQSDYERDMETPSANGTPFNEDKSLTDSIASSIQNCSQSYNTESAKALTDSDSVLGHAEYEYSNRVIEETSASGSGGPVNYLRDIQNIRDNVIKNADSEKNLLDSSLLDLAEGKYEEKLTAGEPEGYDAQLSSGAGAAAAETVLTEQFDETEKCRSELEFLIDAYKQRESAANALTYVNGCITWSKDLHDSVPQDAFRVKADGSIDSHIKWLTDLAQSIKASDDSLKTKLDELNDKKEELQQKRDQALDDNDLAGAAAYDKMIEAVDKDIAEEEKNTGKSSDDDMADNIMNNALKAIAEDPKADVSSAVDALNGIGQADKAGNIEARKDAAGAGSGSGSGAGSGSGSGAGSGSGSGAGSGSGSGAGSEADAGAASGAGENDILSVIEGMFGTSPENMAADELAIVTAGVSRFGRSGNRAASSLAAGYAELMRSKNSRYLYSRFKAASPVYISVEAVGYAGAYRYYYDDTKQTATLTKGAKAYSFKNGTDMLSRGNSSEKLDYKVEMQNIPYISESDASALFDTHAEYVTGSKYAVCLSGVMEGRAKELYEALLEL